MPAPIRTLFASLTAVVIAAGGAFAQSQNTTLLAHVHNYTSYSGVWGYTAPNGTELAIIGTQLGTSFVNVTNPATPVEVAYISGPDSGWREIRCYGHYAYISNENSSGVAIVDLVNPLAPVLVTNYNAFFESCHSVHLDTQTGYLYCNGCNGPNEGTFILNVGANPTAPPQVGFWPRSNYYIHDCYSRDGIAYFAAILQSGFDIVNVGALPTFNPISFTTYSGAFTHNCWLTDDSRYLLTTDELTGGHLRVWDVQNLASPVEVGHWSHPDGGADIIHNVYVRGNLAFASWYTAGLQVFDISDPTTPLRVGYYDTYPGSGGFAGAWGCYPFAASGNIYISDIETGLYVFRFDANYGLLKGTVVDQGTGLPIAGVAVHEATTNQSAVTDALGHYSMAFVPGTYSVDFSKFAYVTESDPISITLGQTNHFVTDLALQPAGTVSGVVRSSQGGGGLAGALVAILNTPLTTTSGAGGAFSIPAVPEGDYMLEAALVGFGHRQGGITVVANHTVSRDLVLSPSFLVDTAETDQGWTLGLATDNATGGRWVRADPQGTNGGTVQPEDDHTPAPGAICFVTGNCPGDIPGCGVNANDVDGGRTTLLSPTWNLTGRAGAVLQYYRWFVNTTGTSGTDFFRVDVSSNGGTNWVNVESLNQNRAFWERKEIPLESFITLTNNVKARFVANDTGADNTVEAAIDDIELLIPPAPTAAPTIEAPAALLTIEPNPVREAATLRLNLSLPQPVELSVVNVQGRVVRQLAVGVMQAGSHLLHWDGRDASGRRTPAGLYLVKLVTASESRSEKLLLLQ